MGALTLPQGGLVAIDTNVVIYSVEKIEPYWSLLQPLWAFAKAGNCTIIGSELLLLETLVKPLRDQDALLEATFRSLLLASHELRLIPIDLTILDSAARLRATVGLRTPDAIHAATALLVGSTLCMTNDSNFRRVPGLAVTILDDLLTS